jgi:hypothetical protein
MRLGPVLLVTAIFSMAPKLCLGQDTGTPRARPARPDVDRVASSSPSENAPDAIALPVKRLLEKWHPVHERLVQDDRLRLLSGAVGLGVVAYEGVRSRSHLSLAFVGTEALRIGLHPQLNAVRERTGFAVEPSLGYRRFEVTFRKTLD